MPGPARPGAPPPHGSARPGAARCSGAGPNRDRRSHRIPGNPERAGPAPLPGARCALRGARAAVRVSPLPPPAAAREAPVPVPAAAQRSPPADLPVPVPVPVRAGLCGGAGGGGRSRAAPSRGHPRREPARHREGRRRGGAGRHGSDRLGDAGPGDVPAEHHLLRAHGSPAPRGQAVRTVTPKGARGALTPPAPHLLRGPAKAGD